MSSFVVCFVLCCFVDAGQIEENESKSNINGNVGFYPQLSNLYNFCYFDNCTLLDGAMKQQMTNYVDTLKIHGFAKANEISDNSAHSDNETDIAALRKQIESLKREFRCFFL